MPLFSRAVLEKKPITTMYTDAKVDGHSIKLILDSESADSIITQQLMDQLGDFSFEVNSIIILIKVLVMEATQYQALVGNDWLFKTNTVLDWNIQELQISQNGHHTHVPATCSYFKTTIHNKSLIELEEEKKNLPEKPTKFPKLTLSTMSCHQYYSEMTIEREKKGETYQKCRPNMEENTKRKGKRKEEKPAPITTTTTTHISYTYTTLPPSNYHQLKLVYIDCDKKLFTMDACYGDNEEWPMDNKSCLACGETLLDKRMWNNIPRRRETCNKLYQYTILISDWIRKETPIEAAWKRAVKQTIKNNSPELIKLDWGPNSDIILESIDPKQFYKHYQELAFTREEQEQ
ncbi:hypothetical protein G9A89_008000 [Geosiphon pyriformis]|nr:hypothetical protein G9A89_008000 [Geosiphon pyriformis]